MTKVSYTLLSNNLGRLVAELMVLVSNSSVNRSATMGLMAGFIAVL